MDLQTPTPRFDFPLKPQQASRISLPFPLTPSPCAISPVAPMTGPMRTNDEPRIPRPCNAWIIFRTEMLEKFGPDAQRDQGLLSKAISLMWRTMPPSERAIYDRKAEEVRLQHQRQYPNYQYRPRKKAEKERERREKKEEKEREKSAKRPQRRGRKSPSQSKSASPVPTDFALAIPQAAMAAITTSSGGHAPESSTFYYSTPSPPLSAAASPRTPDSRLDYQLEASTSYGAQTAFTSPFALPLEQQILSDQGAGTTGLSMVSVPIDQPYQRETNANGWAVRLLGGTPDSELTAGLGYAPPTTLVNQDFLSFTFQPMLGQNLAGQSFGDHTDFLQHLVSPTRHPEVFQLDDRNQFFSVDDAPTGPLDIGMPITDFTTDFASELNSSHTAGDSLTWSTLFSAQQFQPLASFNADDFIDFTGSAGSSAPVAESPTPSTGDDFFNAASPAAEQRAPYVPPSGAAYSSTRRVGGTWQLPFPLTQDPIEVKSPLSWTIPAA